jgi:hypothetical protein
MNVRLSAVQKNAMTTMHFVELKLGLHTPVNTSYIRKVVEQSLCKELSPNHFLVSLRTLAKNGYVVFQPNYKRSINSNAKENESMWQLTDEGRRYAETLHCERMRPKRRRVKKSKPA